MNGIKKTALFLSGLEWKTVDLLLGQLDPETARMLRREMMSLGDVSEKESKRLADEFLRKAGRQPAVKPATYTAPVAKPVRFPAESFEPRFSNPFDFLRNENAEAVAGELESEHPQTAAAVLAHLPRSRSADVLRLLPIPLRQDVADRLARYEPMDTQILSDIAAALRQRFKPAHFSFDDLERLGNSELSTLFHSVDPRTAVLALVGAKPSLIERITKRFSPTEEHRMRQELKHLGPFDEQDINRARQTIMEQVSR